MYLRFVLWCAWIVTTAWLICGVVGWTGCASEIQQRQKWQDCSAVYHEECWNRPPSLARECEYEYYKECVND